MLKNILNHPIKQSLFVIINCFSISVFLFCTYSFYNHFNKIKELENKYIEIESTTLNSLSKRKEKIDFLSKHNNCNPNYLIDFFSKKDLLVNEKANFNYLNAHPCFYRNPLLEKKINIINKNKFDFLIGDQYEKNNIKETSIVLKCPVYCSYNDLTEILSTIDNVSTDKVQKNEKSPQIIPHYINIEFNDFDCLFDCKVLQREF